MRHIRHPGPVAAARTSAVGGSPVALRFVLEPGQTVDAAIAKGFEAAGCAGGFVEFRGGRCEPFRYVIPAASPDDRHAAWYSATFEPKGAVDFSRACAIVGFRDGGRFMHCHGIWNTADGPRMGHLLAPDTRVAEPITVEGIGLRNATFQGMPDAETNFTLFEPVEAPGGDLEDRDGLALLAKVRPNQDIILAIEEICLQHGIRSAHVYGIGSLNEVRFADGTQVNSHATEVQITRGIVETEEGRPRARLDIDVVDMEGRIFSGELTRADNPVCVTFELVIQAVERSAG